MDPKPSDPLPSAPREVLDAEIFIVGELKDPVFLRDLGLAMRKLPGVQEFVALADKLIFHYEPVVITKAELVAAVRKAGLEVEGVELGSASPLSDAFEEAIFGEGKPEVTPLPSDLA